MPVDAESVKGGRRPVMGGSKPWLCCAAASVLASCYGAEDDMDEIRDTLMTMPTGVYRAVDEFYGNGTALLVNDGDEVMDFETQTLGFEWAGDSVNVYATPWDKNGCIRKMFAGKIEPKGSGKFFLRPIGDSTYYLDVKPFHEYKMTGYYIVIHYGITGSGAGSEQLVEYAYVRSKPPQPFCP